MKKLLSIILVAVMLLCTFPMFSFAAEETYATIVSASDFQGNTDKAVTRFTTILNKAKSDGITINGGLFGGDYAGNIGVGPDGVLRKIQSAAVSVNSSFNTNNMIFVEGNHDVNGTLISKTGLHDLGSYLVYSLNEDDFFASQSSRTYGSQGIKLAVEKAKMALENLVANDESRPVFVITHVPLHHTRRSSYGDNLYSKYLFDVLNKAAESLDIVFLFGHNHSNTYDDYIGGAVNYLAKGETIRIPIPSNDSRGENGYTEETLKFTYMNCGYVGYSNNTEDATSTKTLTANFIQLQPTKIVVSRYTTSGIYSTETIAKINKTTPTATKNVTDKPPMKIKETTFSSGVTELKDGMYYIIGSAQGETKEIFAAKAENKVVANTQYLGFKDEAVNAVYDEETTTTTITTTDASVVYQAEEIDGNIYLKSVETGKYITQEKYSSDSTYSSGRVNFEFIDKAQLDSSSVCAVTNGQLKIGSYIVHHSSSYYFYAKASSATQVLYEGYIEPDVDEPEIDDPAENPDPPMCNHMCHSTSGFYSILWKVVRFFLKLFGAQKTCSCGAVHY